ncbi:SDR family NAD(P)-dependent oxidoreductase [Streptomyces coelicoflavus]|uniref:SDR family NAD(P)-dependent oxidoreductase n=1 Tax=Streptomyces coelicoflavus TaxID=285562 RepID=UPI003450EC14
MPVAIITGASKGLGRALAEALAARGWDLVLDARNPEVLGETETALKAYGSRVTALSGDVTDAWHRTALVAEAGRLGGVDLLVSNASALGAEPLVRLEELPLDGLRRALEVNVVAALGLVREALPSLRAAPAGAVVTVSSDAAAEEPGLRVWAVDPGDMATDLYAAAVPDDDDPRPDPASVVPALLRLLDERPASGRYGAPALLESR